jgi:hypothetical protein
VLLAILISQFLTIVVQSRHCVESTLKMLLWTWRRLGTAFLTLVAAGMTNSAEKVFFKNCSKEVNACSVDLSYDALVRCGGGWNGTGILRWNGGLGDGMYEDCPKYTCGPERSYSKQHWNDAYTLCSNYNEYRDWRFCSTTEGYCLLMYQETTTGITSGCPETQGTELYLMGGTCDEDVGYTLVPDGSDRESI